MNYWNIFHIAGFLKGQRGQTTVTHIIGVAAAIFVGILVISSLYEGSIAAFHDDELLGNMTANYTEFTTDYIPISSDSTHTIVVKNQSATFTVSAAVPCEAPCYIVAGGYAVGNVTVNATPPDLSSVSTDDLIYIDYYDTKMAVGTGLTTAIAAFGYLWVGIGFLGLGLLVLGAMYVLRIIREMS